MDPECRDSILIGDAERLGQLLDAGGDVNALDRYGQTGLMLAARAGRSDVVRLLIARGARLDHAAKYNLTAVMLAVIFGHVEIVRMLVRAGADLDRRGSGAPGFNGLTAMDLAVGRADPALVEALQR